VSCLSSPPPPKNVSLSLSLSLSCARVVLDGMPPRLSFLGV
jgi:hypothetical protein